MTALSQSIFDMQVEGVSKKEPLKNFLTDIEKRNDVKFFFREEWLEPYTITPEENGKSLMAALHDILGNEVRFTLMFKYAVVFSIDLNKVLLQQDIIEKAVAQKWKIDEVVIGNKDERSLSRNVTIKGTIKNELDNSPISNVTIELENDEKVFTDVYGNYEFIIPQGEHIITYRISNHRGRVIILKAYASGVLDFTIEDAPTVLQEVVITDRETLKSRAGQTYIKIADMNRSPTFLGEVDLIKTIQTQAGVTTVGEIASGFNVRGGSVDQNLVLYDGIPIFNTTHALGFFTAFNSASIKDVSFFRGAIPAEYGGRSSSVLTIDAAEGDANKWKVNGSVGLISSDITVGGPIKRDTTLITASFRSSYSDWMLDLVRSKYNLRKSSLSFYDGSFKLTHKPNQKTKISFSGYTSLDRFTLINDTSYSIRNIAASLRFDRTWSSKLFGSITLGFGQYTYLLKEEDASTAFNLEYGVTYPSLNFDFNLEGKHKLAFGFHNRLYSFNPGSLEPGRESTLKRIHLDRVPSLESAVYLSEEFSIHERIFLEAGLRYSLFANLGSATIYQYAPGEPLEIQNVIDSTVYDDHRLVKFYHGLEPRLSVRYNVGSNASLKLGYNRMYQYLHMISNTAATAPIDVWQSGNPFFMPQRADQVSLGYYRNMKENIYQIFAEIFYKGVKNVYDFKDGADLVLNKNLETELLNGKAHSYGLELSISKVSGRLIVSGNYTFSRSFRQVDGKYETQKINEGKVYASNFDQPHVLNLAWRYAIRRRIFFSGNFSYRTGRPMSLPEGAYTVDGIPITDFPYRNEYRIPDYHRMDVALIVEENHKLRKKWHGAWIFSFYNVYARRNAYAVFYKKDSDGYLYPYTLSVIGTIIPSITYRFQF